MAGRKGSLIAAAKAASERVAAEAAAPVPDHAPPPAAPAPPARPELAAEAKAAGYVTTAIHVPKDVLALLRRVAVERANRHGGRPSVSAVLVDLVQSHRDDLERDAER